jgi:hypothetical protein
MSLRVGFSASDKAGLVWLLAAMVCSMATLGCVQRRMTVRSNPPGAMLYIDNQEIGTTPVSTNFTYYGTREFRLVKDGCETLTEKRTIPVPWYQFVPLDFVAENLVPGEIRDHRTLDFQLVPQRIVPTEEILDRAETLRGQARASGVVQAGPVPRRAAPPGQGIPAAPAGPWGSAPGGLGQGGGAVPPAWGPGTQPAAPPGPSSGEVLPYPTAPPGGWQ